MTLTPTLWKDRFDLEIFSVNKPILTKLFEACKLDFEPVSHWKVLGFKHKDSQLEVLFAPSFFSHSSVLVDILNKKASLPFQSLQDNSPFIYTICSFLNHLRNFYFNDMQDSTGYDRLNKYLACNCQHNSTMRGYYFLYN